METASPLVRITFFACIAAVAAAFLRAPAQQAAPETTRTPPQTAAPAAAPTGTGMQLLCAYAGSAPSDPAAPDARSLLADIAHGTTLDFLIATVPDPVDSHLDWAFDQQLDSLRRAHETAGYVVDGYWLPWSSDPALSDAEREANRAQRPGAILFRRDVDERVELRLLYLVGEIPTNGVNRRAFRAALAERDGLRGSFRSALGAGECADTLRVVGPVFSGASTSMRDVLRAWIDQQRDTRCVDIVSGAATNAENERRLAGEQGAPALAVEPLPAGERERPSLAAGGIRFTATIHTDETLLRVLRESILRPLGFNPSEVAILQESSTQYGASVAAPAQHAPESNAQEKGAPQPDMRATSREHPRDEPPSIHAQEERSPTDGFLVVPFPMNISSLRAAYAREEVPEAMRGSTPRVQLDLEERERLRHGEIPRALSQLSTPATDIVMSEIASALDRRHVRAVVLFATDVRDKLFLGREIAKRLPDVQLITTESNLLYLSHALDRALCGMLVLSTYPLLVYPSDWEPQSAGTPDQQIVFASEGAEGVYNAALLQLGSGRAMTNYAMPVGAHAAEFRLSRPPVWLTCVGRTTMQPLSVFPGAPRSAYYPVGVRVDGARTSEKSGGSAPRSEPMSLLSIGLTFVFGLAVLIAAGRVLYGLRGNALSRRLLRGIDRKKGASTGYSAADVRNVLYALHDEGYSAMGMLVLLGLFLPHATLVRGFLRSAESLGVDAPRDLSILSHACTWIVALAVLALAIDVWQAAVILGDHSARVVRYFRRTFAGASLLMFLFVLDAGVRIAIVIAAASFAWCSVCFAAEVDAVAEDPTRFELFAHRAMAIDEGVSPLLPLFLVGLGLGAWCVWHLLRIRHLARTLPFVDFVVVTADASKDGTAAAARAAGAIVPEPEMIRGKGYAIVKGIAATRTLGADIVILMDSDGQHLPEEIPVMLAPLLDGRAELVSGSRMLGTLRTSRINKFGNWGLKLLSFVVTWKWLTDTETGYRAFLAEKLYEIELESRGYEIESELMMRALHKRLKIVEVPITVPFAVPGVTVWDGLGVGWYKVKLGVRLKLGLEPA